jgi:broad specificity phosphatase PhoE
MPARLTLISHARTPAQAGAYFPADDAIDDKNVVTRCRAISGTFRRINIALTAPELRTRQTAEALGLSPAIIPVLADCNYGSWSGFRLSDIQERDPQGVAAWISGPGSSPHGGETILDVIERVSTWLSQYQEPGHTIAVTHPSVIRAAIIHTLSATPQAFWRIDVEPLSVTDLRRHSTHWTLRSTGRIRIGEA